VTLSPSGPVTRPLLNSAAVASWARGEGFADLRPSAWHVTVAGGLPECVSLDPAGLTLPPSPARTVIRMGGFVVLTVVSFALARRHRRLRGAGAPWEFRRYRPHVTFTVADGRDLGTVRPYVGALDLGPETTD
jgi:hypothetical protein